MQGANAIIQILQKEGVEQIFCFPTTPLLEACAEEGLRPIVARQERVAENMADGFSRASFGDRIGAVTVQQSAGAENAFAGIAHARTDSSPILFLPGHPGIELAGVPPTFDSVPNYTATTKWADTLPSASSIPGRMRRAFTCLRTGRQGPVLVEVPVDVAGADFPGPLEYTPVAPARSGGDPSAIRDAARLLLAARRPMIWAGQGVLYAKASGELTEVAELLAAPVMTTLLGKSGFNERHPLSLGTGSYSQTEMVTDYLKQADAIFGIGASLTRTAFAPEIDTSGCSIVHATNDARDLNKDYQPQVTILGDAKLVLEQLREEIRAQSGGKERPERAEVEAHVGKVRAAWRERWAPKLSSSEVPINPYRVMGEFMKHVDPADAIVTHDSGNPRDQLVPIYESVTPRGYIGWGHSTQLGFSLGAAMGAKLAQPDKLVVNFLGDTAIGMVGMDIETAVREQIPILTVLLNNGAMGNYHNLIPKAVERYGTKYLTGNYSEVARGLGAHSERIDKPEEVAPALKRGIAATREGTPALIEFMTCEEPDFNVVKGGSH